MDTVLETQSLLKDIYKTYKKAPKELKRIYLGLFWEGFTVKDKELTEAKASKILSALLQSQKVRIVITWLPVWDALPVCL